MEDKKMIESNEKPQLSTEKLEFNPRIAEVSLEDERFFAYESQRAHA